MTLALFLLLAAPVQEPPPPAPPPPRTPWELLAGRYDRDRDGRITPQEYRRGKERFQRLGRNGDGVLTRTDWQAPGLRPGPGRAARRTLPDPAPRAGEPAPDFELPLLHGKEGATLRLSSFRGRKPVALIFGSWT